MLHSCLHSFSPFLVAVRRFPRPSRSIHFGDVSSLGPSSNRTFDAIWPVLTMCVSVNKLKRQELLERWIGFLLDNAIGFPNTHPLDRDLSCG